MLYSLENLCVSVTKMYNYKDGISPLKFSIPRLWYVLFFVNFSAEKVFF